MITSPPYYGLRTYVPDQWLRYWFLGSPSEVEYSAASQLLHPSPETFASELRSVWQSVGAVCAPGAQLVIRFGGINNRKADPLSIVKASLGGSGFEIRSLESAGSAANGQRQALHFSRSSVQAREEHDVRAVWLA